MSAALGDPVLLATYAVPSSVRKGKGKEVAPEEHPIVFASFSSVSKRNDEQVTLAVQGDGIHVYELGDLHPVSSHAFGPSTNFASAPVAVICTDGESSTRRLYIAVQSSQDVKREEAGRVIWSWKEPESGQVGSLQDRQSTTLPHDIAYLLTLQDSSSIIAISHSCSLTWMDLDLDMKNAWYLEGLEGTEQRLTKLFTFSARDCGFLQSGTSNEHAVIMFVERGEKLLLQILILGPEYQLIALDPIEIPLGQIDRVVEISLDSSGNLSALGLNGIWSHFILELKNGLTSLSPGNPPLHLKSLTFISDQKRRASNVALLSLGSSFVLLAGTASKDIALLLWDIRFGVLLHSTTLPIPSSLESSVNGVSVQLSKGSSSQALLILSPRTENLKRTGQLRSSVLVVPFSVPKRSTIADAMGKAAQGAPWLVASPPESRKQEEDVHGKGAMLASLQEAIDRGQTKQADDIFFNWVKEHDEGAKGTKTTATVAEDDAAGPRDVEMEGGEEQKRKETKKPTPLKNLLDHAFVTRILSVVLPAEKPSSKPYSPKISRYLVTKHLVSHSMVTGGLLDALVQRNDWETIRECFWYVVDLPENELLRLLHIVVRYHRKQSTTDQDAAIPDKRLKKRHREDGHWQGMPPITSFLARVVDYPASSAAWRTALREHFADIEDLMSLLIIADEWIDAFSTKDLPIGLGEVTQNEHGVFVPEQEESNRTFRTGNPSMPSLENFLTFLQAVLDSSFLKLLQNPVVHPLLRRISENISQMQAENLGLQSLRGPLGPFARAQSKALAEAADGGKKREEVDWRKRRKQAHEQAALNLGPYQVEELVF